MKKLIYLFLTVLIVGCSGEDNNNDNNPNDGDNTVLVCNGDNPVYLADNGVTIKACDDANIGDTGVIDGVTYTVVDNAMLREMVANGEDVTKIATTMVTDMSELIILSYDEQSQAVIFNQPIGNWDVSGVTTMFRMFVFANNFNQPIRDWDVSNVADMSEMFAVASVFNQPIGDWDVSSVTNMQMMFEAAGDFNQPIGDWDVSNVTDMRGMFLSSPFNQPIGGWNVSNVTDMAQMFYDATSFNKDLSSWSVDGVTQCSQFSDNATSWTLPKPNFTNCTP